MRATPAIVQNRRDDSPLRDKGRGRDAALLWRRYARVYDHALLDIPAYRDLLERVSNLVRAYMTCRRAVILDIGCGTGNLLIELLDIPCRLLVGADRSVEMLAAAITKINRIQDTCLKEKVALLRTDILEGIPIVDESVDCLVCNHVLYALPDVEHALLEFSRILVPGGLFVTTNMTAPLSFRTVVLPLLRECGFGKGLSIICRNLRATYLNWRIGCSQKRGNMHYWNEAQFRSLIECFGFRVIHQERAYIGGSDILTVANCPKHPF